MKTHTIISITLCCCLLLFASYASIVPVEGSKKTADWPDGEFSGKWVEKNDNTIGSLHGTVNQGRRSTQGVFVAEWNSSDGIHAGQMQGIFKGGLIIGYWQNTNTGKKVLFLGTLSFNDTQFTARVRSLGVGVVEITGVHDLSFLPRLTGSYGVGVKTMHLIDSSRPENFTNDSNDVREMMVQIWYPIERSTISEQALYMDPLTFLWLKGRSPVPLFTIPDTAYMFVRPHERDNAPIAPGMFPVIIFSPGYDGVYQIYTSFIEDMASHGFVVVSINHPYVSGITVFPDNHTVGLAPVPTDPAEQAAFFSKSLRVIVQDAKFVLNTTAKMNTSDLEFAGHLDLSHVGMYGHSFGGANTAVCCYEDSRFLAGLTLDGVFYANFTAGNITRPFFMMVAQARFSNDSSIQYMWDHITGDTYKVGILGSTHYAYTDVGVLLSHLVPLIPPRILGFGTIAPKRMLNITRSYVDAFFDVYLKGAPREQLLALSSVFPEVEIAYKLQ
jgi:dienelactone hydrolase